VSFRLNWYYLRDARRIRETVHDKIVDVIITSPPYSNLKDYGFNRQIGYGQDYESEYLADLQDVFGQCYAVTKDTGSLWVVLDTFKRGGTLCLLPFDVANRLGKIGWELFDIIIWNKTKGLPWSRKGQLRNVFEYILFFVKSNRFKYNLDRIKDPKDLKEWWVKYPERYSPRGKVPTNIWNIPIPVQGSWANVTLRHFCPFPPELVEKILLLTTDQGDVVLDPFAGSGIVLAQAECMRRKYIGFDLKTEYIKMFRKDIRSDTKFWWNQRRQYIKALEEGRETLEDIVKKLRQVKFPKAVLKELLKKRGVQDDDAFFLNTIFAISEEFPVKTNNDKHKFMKEILYLVIENKIDKQQIISDLNEILRKPPLSKYGILAEVRVITVEDFVKTDKIKASLVRRQLWLYANGVMHKYTRSITFKNWLTMSMTPAWRSYYGNNVPPVISNIRVNQLVKRTWRIEKKASKGVFDERT
jgi:DNA modification methylase